MPDIHQRIDCLIDQADQLHSSPHVVSKLLAILQDADCDTQEIVDCLACDPALSAAILRLVNSS